MAFKRFNGRRRFGRGRRRFGTRRFVRKVAKVAKRTIRRMHEIKRSIVAVTIPATSGTWNVADVTPVIAQGIDKNERIGNRIQYRFCTINIQLFNQNEEPDVNVHASFVRVVVFTARNNLVVGITDILEDGVATTANDGTIFLPLRSENVNVLMDKKFTMGSAALQNTAGGNQATQLPYIKTVKFARRLMRNTTFKTAAANVPSAPQDQIHVLIGNSNGSTNLFGNIGVRLSYIDI